MAPVIHCVRHAQGIHNIGTSNYGVIDPHLTETGHEQCRALREEFPRHENIELVVASPLRRTIYTALNAFLPVFESNPALKLIALPDIQELSDLPCDTGSDIATLQKEVQDKHLPVDLRLVPRGWDSKSGKYAPDYDAIEKRASDARAWLNGRPEKEIVLLSHGGFLHFFTEDYEDANLYEGTGWANMEYRTYEFSNNGKLVETDVSRSRRGKHGASPTREEQKVLSHLCKQQWAEQGLQPSAAERARGHDL